MPQLYLIRRENRIFLGPMNAEAFRDGLRKMTFGLQDEVAGHCGKWVILDNEEQIRKNYPELVSIISAELPVAWREMTGHAKQISKKDQKVKAVQAKERERSSSSSRRSSSADIESYGRSRKRRGNALLFGFVLIAAAAIGAGVYVKTHDEPLPPVTEIAALAQKTDPNEFLNEMGNRIIPMVGKINRGKDPQNTWLPYVRMYAFYTNGMVDNVPMKTLRGSVPAYAPQDCSVDSWKKRWRENAPQTAAWINGKSLVRTQMTRALSWDPQWIRRRPMKGWLKPRNWFEGCLMSATVAMRAIAVDANLGADPGVVTMDMVAAVSRRLQAELEIIQNGHTSIVGDANTVLGSLTCMDQAENYSALQRCRTKFTDVGLQQFTDEHANWQWVRLALASPTNPIEPALLADINQGVSKLVSEDMMSKLDFSAELRFLQLLQQSAGKLDGVVERVGSEFADVRLR